MRPGEQPPTLSADAKANKPFNAVRFARYYLLTTDWSIATGM
jgi:hypothetical protein